MNSGGTKDTIKITSEKKSIVYYYWDARHKNYQSSHPQDRRLREEKVFFCGLKANQGTRAFYAPAWWEGGGGEALCLGIHIMDLSLALS